MVSVSFLFFSQRHGTPPIGLTAPPLDEFAISHTTRTWVLLSGGLDSTACLAFFLAQDIAVQCLHIDYGQPAAQRELAAATAVSRHFGVRLNVLQWSGSPHISTGHIAGRNAFLLVGALLHIGPAPSLLAIGIHDGTPYYDCSAPFLSTLQALFDRYCDGRVRISAPFLTWSKQQVYEFSKRMNIPASLTYSCEAGQYPPCATCLSCQDRHGLDVS